MLEIYWLFRGGFVIRFIFSPGIRNICRIYPSEVMTSCFSKGYPFDVTISSSVRFSSGETSFSVLKTFSTPWSKAFNGFITKIYIV